MTRPESMAPKSLRRRDSVGLPSTLEGLEPSIEDLERHRLRLEAKIAELQLANARALHTQKLEAIGQLAAGIAHEINTPTQYVTDNVEFLSRAFEQLAEYFGVSGNATPGGAGKIPSARIDYILRETPKAIEQSLEGLRRIASIVSAMKAFSHPSEGEKDFCDLNEAIQSTVMVATNEWKYVADIETHFDAALPEVCCLRDELNQVILNLIINAAHAIDVVVEDGTKGKGKITISTQHDNGWALIRIADTGCGIPDKYRARIFDPFFTTKPVGRGTGQGLAIAYSVIVEKHGGEIMCDSEVGRGTTFVLRIPVCDNDAVTTSAYLPPRSVV